MSISVFGDLQQGSLSMETNIKPSEPFPVMQIQ